MEQITGTKQVTGLLGCPVSHSKSPIIHNEGFKYHNLEYHYYAFDVDTHSLGTAIEKLCAVSARGFNLTMPNKTAACQYCDKLSPAAEIIGAINTVVNDGGILTGYATDGIGFMRAIKEAGADIIGKKMTLLGTGGAATAIFVQAALDGVSEISIFNRHGASYDRASKIIELLKDKSCCKITLFDYHDQSILKREISESQLLVNGTSVGMAPNINESLITDKSFFHEDLFVSDIIYHPEETLLLKLAREAGCKTQNGLSMLLYQAAESFRLWTEKDLPIELIKEKYF